MEFSENVSVASLGSLLSTLKVSSKLVGRVLRKMVTRNRGTFIYYYQDEIIAYKNGYFSCTNVIQDFILRTISVTQLKSKIQHMVMAIPYWTEAYSMPQPLVITCLIASVAPVVGRYQDIFWMISGMDCGGQMIPLRNSVGKHMKNEM